MRVLKIQSRRVRPSFNPERRKTMKRLASAALALLCAASVASSIGCKSTQKKESKTIDDFLQEDKPSW